MDKPLREIGLELEADLFLREIQISRQSRLLLGSGNESEHPARIALRQKFVADRWQQRADALQELQMLRRLLGRRREKQDDIDLVIIKGKSVIR